MTIFENEIAFVLIIKNESRYIEEWLEYHYRIGVDKFYIYDNDSEDRSELLKILDPWIRAGIVDIKSISGIRMQMPAYNDAIEKHKFDCRYMGFIDTDEFIYIKTGQSLLKILNDHFNQRIEIAGLPINWRMFGTSGRQKYEPIDVIERFIYRTPDDHLENIQIKAIVNPRRIAYIETPHNACYTLGSGCYDLEQNLITKYYNSDNNCDVIQLNHYFTKSEEEFHEKLSRGRADNGDLRNDHDTSNYNDVEDVGLRNLWRQIKSQPLPKPKDHSPQKILENICEMLEPFTNPNVQSEFFKNQIETFLTCFFLVRKSTLIDESERQNLTEFILQLIDRVLRDKQFDAYQIVLLIYAHTELLETKSEIARDIVKRIYSQLPRLIFLAGDITMHAQRFYLQQVQKDLALILN